ncbi:hypothetical protein HK097_003544, partial [Rhizophlyctis rosea]
VERVLIEIGAIIEKSGIDNVPRSLFEQLTSIAAGYASIDGVGVNATGARLWGALTEQSELALQKDHQDLFARLDPHYVIADVPAAGLPAPFLPAVVAYPPVGSPHAAPAALDGSAIAYTFGGGVGGRQAAEHFVEYMQLACQGLRFWVFSPALAPTYM